MSLWNVVTLPGAGEGNFAVCVQAAGSVLTGWPAALPAPLAR